MTREPMDLEDAIMVGMSAILDVRAQNEKRKRRTNVLDMELADLKRAYKVLETECDRQAAIWKAAHP